MPVPVDREPADRRERTSSTGARATPAGDPWPLPAALLLAGLLLSGITLLEGVAPNDEGLMLRAAERIAAGQVPYRDFWWFYPPGQPYLLGWLRELAGPSLLSWRIVRVLTDATVALLVYALARRQAGRGPALAAWLVAACAMAYPSGPHPFPLALALALGALLALERRPLLAGALTGVCAVWRIEFALALAVGAVAGLALGPGQGRSRAAPSRIGAVAGLARGPGPRRAAGYLTSAAATAALLYAPVVAAAGPGPVWDLLVDYPATDFREYQSLPFPLAYDGPLNTSSVRGFVDDTLEPLALHLLPLALVLGLAAGLVAALSLRPARAGVRPLTAATVTLALGMLAYQQVRTDLFHTAPLAVLVAVLGAWAIGTRGPGWRALPALVCAGALTFAAVEGLDRRWLALRQDTVALDLPGADGVRMPAREAAQLAAAVRAAQRLAPPGRPIYVTGSRSDLVTAGHPLFNVLARRPNPTRYDIAAPGIVTSAPVQREIVAALERSRTPLVVRWTSPLTAAPEPNAAGRSSGVRLLDEQIAARYAPAARFGELLLLRRRP